MKRLIAAILLSALTTSPVYALRPRGADADPMQRAIAGGLEERGFATAASRAGTVMTVLRLGLYLMGIQTTHQSALAASRILPDVRDILEALKTAVQLIGDHPLELWVYRPHEVTVAQQALFSEQAEVLRRRFFEVFQNNSASIESLTRALLAVTDGPYRGNLDYEFLVEHRIPALIGEAPATAGDRVRLVRAIRLATILGLGGNTVAIEGLSNDLSTIQSRLEKLLVTSGLEENSLDRVILSKVGKAHYDAVVFGPGVPSLGLVAVLAYRKSRIPFRIIAEPERARAIVALIQKYGLNKDLPDNWETEWILGGSAEQFQTLVQRILAGMRAASGVRKILVIRGTMDPAIASTSLIEDRIVWNFSNDKSFRVALSELLDGYGLEIGRASLDLLMDQVRKARTGLEELQKQY